MGVANDIRNGLKQYHGEGDDLFVTSADVAQIIERAIDHLGYLTGEAPDEGVRRYMQQR